MRHHFSRSCPEKFFNFAVASDQLVTFTDQLVTFLIKVIAGAARLASGKQIWRSCREESPRKFFYGCRARKCRRRARHCRRRKVFMAAGRAKVAAEICLWRSNHFYGDLRFIYGSWQVDSSNSTAIRRLHVQNPRRRGRDGVRSCRVRSRSRNHRNRPGCAAKWSPLARHSAAASCRSAKHNTHSALAQEELHFEMSNHLSDRVCEMRLHCRRHYNGGSILAPLRMPEKALEGKDGAYATHSSNRKPNGSKSLSRSGIHRGLRGHVHSGSQRNPGRTRNKVAVFAHFCAGKRRKV